VSIPKTPIKCFEGSIIDQDGFLLMDDEIARDLTEFYETKRKQEECGKTGHINADMQLKMNHCVFCGADLTKGAKT